MKYERILLPIDLNQPKVWGHSIDVACTVARQHDAEVIVVYVAPELEANLNRFPEDYKPKLKAWVDDFMPKEVKAVPMVKAGATHREICNIAKEKHVDLIVMGAQNPTLRERMMGSNASFVVLHAPTSVYVVR